MDPVILEQLRDIHGLDSLPWWHITPGWWITAALMVALLLLVPYFLRRPRHTRWQKEADRHLRRLRRRLRKESPRLVLSELSELLRRAAMARHGRQVCAGLEGEAWLTWLQDHDPGRFAWQSEGRILLTLAYAPPDTEVDPAQVRRLMSAVQGWTQSAAGGKT